MNNKVFICIPVHNRINYSIECLKSIFKQTYSDFHVIISDADSSDLSAEIISQRFPEKVSIIHVNKSNWWTGGINSCIRYALEIGKENDFVFTLNNDTELAPDCLENIVNFANNNPKCLIGCLNLFFNETDRIEPSASIIKRFLFFFYQKRLFSFGQKIPEDIKDYYFANFLSGKGVLIPLEVFRETGLFEERLLPHYHADGEFAFRSIGYGYRPVLLTDARLYSHVLESGIGTLDKNPSAFFRSFFSKKSANNVKSIYNYSKLVYKKKWMLYFIPKVFILNAGFIKRLFSRSFKIRG
jgi:GT2 family glycosyltransferase